MTTIVWTVDKLVTLPQEAGQDDVVVNAGYTVTGTNGAVVVALRNLQQFTYTGGSFTPFDQLTQDQVVGWIQTALTPDGVNGICVSIQTSIDNIITPPPAPVPQPLPWLP